MTVLATARRAGETRVPDRSARLTPISALWVLDHMLVPMAMAAALAFAPGVPASIDALDVVALMLLWVLTGPLVGGIPEMSALGSLEDVLRTAMRGPLLVVLVATGCFLLQIQLARLALLDAAAAAVLVAVGGRVVFRVSLRRAWADGLGRQSVVLCGSSRHVGELLHDLRHEVGGYDLLGCVLTDADDQTRGLGRIPVLGSGADIEALIQTHRPDLVLLAGDSMDSAEQVRRLAWNLTGTGTRLVIAPHLRAVAPGRVRVHRSRGRSLLLLHPPRDGAASSSAKRVVDVVGASLLLLAFAPLFALIAWRVHRHDRGPVLFRQVRVGRNGTTFQCWKFRTMVVDAEERLATLRAAHSTDVLFKLADDPRVTTPGRWLRRHSLDELPQLFNVLRGDMSLVGPRPALPVELEHYDALAQRRLLARPGMTGLWQVSGRSTLAFAEAVDLDSFYVDNWSLLMDLHILVRTIGVVVRPRGAY